MEIIINGKRQEVPGHVDLEKLLFDLGLEKTTVAVELNKKIVKRAEYSKTMLQGNDSLEIVHLVGGG